jgi:hypothetical protein
MPSFVSELAKLPKKFENFLGTLVLEVEIASSMQ